MNDSDASRTARRRAAEAGHVGDESSARLLLADPSGAVRASALGALARMGAAREADVTRALSDADARLRRRGCQVAARLPDVAGPELLACAGDADPSVVEIAAWALGERGRPAPEVIERLCAIATTHEEPLCRESAVAALGAIGDERGLPAILAATCDRATVRRRAIIALAPFSGAEVDAALQLAKDDKDWQVRQAAEDLS
ncbi:MAG TPA: HEAT repeat domain-containing protein [Acidimicrobiales bacterium]|nr:HEAT repeat domain-containing protein [Acidimicrobiales bacterium]